MMRSRRRRRVIELFNLHAKEYIGKQKLAPDVLFQSIAADIGITKNGVKYILREENLITTNKALQEQFSE